MIFAIVILGCIYSYLQHGNHIDNQHRQINQALNTRLNFIANGIIERMEHYALGVSSLKATIIALGTKNVDYNTISTFSDTQDYPRRYEGARGFGLAKPVSVENEKAFVQFAQSERPDKSFNISTLNPHNKTRYIIQYIFPENVNFKAIGLDIGSEDNRRTTVIRAAMNNEIALTAPITLVQESGAIEHGFLLLEPLYLARVLPTNESEISDTIYGWAYSPLLIGEILATVTQIGQDKLTIKDLEDQKPFFQNLQDVSSSEHFIKKTVSIYGREWEITLSATEHFLNSLNLASQYRGALQAGILTIVILMAYLLLYSTLQRKAQEAQYEIDLIKSREEKLSISNLKLSTEVVEKNSQLERLHVLNDSILKSAAYAIVATDENGIIRVFNPAAENLLGYQAEEMIDHHSPAIFHLESEIVDRAATLTKELGNRIEPGFDAFVAKARLGKIDTNQWTYITKSGEKVQVRLSVTALLDGNNALLGYLGIAYDLTSTLLHEKELTEARNKAELASQAKSDFLANMSHEIRTPLNGIYGTIQLLKEKDLTSENRTLINAAHNSTTALITIVNDILDFSKIEAGRLTLENEVFNLPVLIEQLNSELSILIKSDAVQLDLSNNVSHEFWSGDVVRIRQILINLVSNAIKFTEKGSVILIASPAPNGGIVFTVKDTGIGIDKTKIHKLFSRFEQADTSTTRRFGGTGLGLAITKKLVDLMGGKIDIYSELNVGTTISVLLPLNHVRHDNYNHETVIESYPDFTGKTILVVEDNNINQLVISSMLQPANANIVVANNGLEGIDAFKKHRPDIIFMDIQMPQMDGLTACKKIKQESPDQIVIALTANAIKSEQELYSEYFDGYLSKPLERLALIKTLNLYTS